jgi:chromosome segregation ATPase
MRALPAGYRTASPDGKVITCYRGEETLGSITAKGSTKEELLAAEEAAVQACEQHAAAIASGEVKPAGTVKAENKQISSLKHQIVELAEAGDQLVAEKAQLERQVQGLGDELEKLALENKTAASELSAAKARIAELEAAQHEKPKK